METDRERRLFEARKSYRFSNSRYTTVDADGGVQELVETERSSTEVVHMECKETGEFAHRETSEYEQLETFNGQAVAENRGNEEYYHLKSAEDEVEFMESNNMPNRAGAPGDAPPGTPGGTLCGNQPLVWVVLTKLENSLARSNRSRFG